MSSHDALYSMANAASLMISPAPAPIMCTPMRRSSLLRPRILTCPSVSPLHLARELAAIGNTPVTYSTPSALSSSSFLPSHASNADNALILGLVCKHGPGHTVSDGVDVVDGSLEAVVHLNLSTLVRLYTDAFEAQRRSIGATAHGDKEGIHFVFLFALFPFGLPRSPQYLGAKLELEALLSEYALEFLRRISINADTPDAVHVLNARHLASQARPYTAELQTNDTCANEKKTLGDLLERERACRRHDRLLVNVNAGKGRHLTSCRNENIFGAQLLRA